MSWEPTEDSSGQHIEVEFPFQRRVSSVFLAGAADKDSWVTKFDVLYAVKKGYRWNAVYNDSGHIMVTRTIQSLSMFTPNVSTNDLVLN